MRATPGPEPFPNADSRATVVHVELHHLSMAPVWEGLGGLSAGASSRLLFDYAEPARSDLLTLLFSPRAGAANQVCKVEISGDGQSSYGSEASAMHFPEDTSWNFGRGYEHWILTEARMRRGTSLKSAALAWTAPYWVGQGEFLSPGGVGYQVNCTRRGAEPAASTRFRAPERSLGPAARTEASGPLVCVLHELMRTPFRLSCLAARCAGCACADRHRVGLPRRLE